MELIRRGKQQCIQSYQYKRNSLFVANDGVHGVELWKSDGTDAGTSMVMDINSGAFNNNPAKIIAMNNVIYFTATGSKGNELWQTDGTPTGTLLLKDIFDDNVASDPLHF